MKRISIFLFLFILFTSCESSDTKSFSFMEKGNKWNYSFLIEGATSEGSYSYEITSSDEDGYFYLNYTDPMGSVNEDWYWYANDEFFADESGAEQDYWFPMVFTVNTVGKKWTSPVDDDELGTLTREIVSVTETVTVPAGTFTNCVKIRQICSADVNIINYIWVSMTDGIVKKESTGWMDITGQPRKYFSVSAKLKSKNF